MPTGNSRLLNASEVAELLGMSESWVRKQTGKTLPCVRLGDGVRASVRYRITDIEAFISGHTQFHEKEQDPDA